MGPRMRTVSWRDGFQGRHDKGVLLKKSTIGVLAWEVKSDE